MYHLERSQDTHESEAMLLNTSVFSGFLADSLCRVQVLFTNPVENQDGHFGEASINTSRPSSQDMSKDRVKTHYGFANEQHI